MGADFMASSKTIYNTMGHSIGQINFLTQTTIHVSIQGFGRDIKCKAKALWLMIKKFRVVISRIRNCMGWE
jgi:hypothetical protein